MSWAAAGKKRERELARKTVVICFQHHQPLALSRGLLNVAETGKCESESVFGEGVVKN